MKKEIKMKYVFFHASRLGFADGSLWVIIDSKKPNVAKIRSTDGSLYTVKHLKLKDCFDNVRDGMWTMRSSKYITR